MVLFGKELNIIRDKLGLSQVEFSKKLGFSRSYICKLESGERKPTFETIMKITKEFNLDFYTKNKLLIISDLEPEFNSSSESYKDCLNLVIFLKEKGLIKEAKIILDKAIKTFDNTIEIYVLMANLHLLKGEYDEAIRINEDSIKLFSNSTSVNIKRGIRKAELIHNLGNVFFERGLKHKKILELSLIENFKDNNSIKTEELKNICFKDLDDAIKNFEISAELEPENEYITEQLARVYLNRGSLDSGKKREKFLKKAIEMYEKVLSFPVKNTVRQEPSIFMAMSYAKIYNLQEASKIINIIINCLPEYAIAFYAKACIFAINGKDKIETLQISYDSLKKSIELEPSLKNVLEYELDLLNLRFNPIFENRFMNLSKKGIKN